MLGVSLLNTWGAKLNPVQASVWSRPRHPYGHVPYPAGYINRGVDFIGFGIRSIHTYFNADRQCVSASSLHLKKDSISSNLPVNSGKYNPNVHNIKSLPDATKEFIQWFVGFVDAEGPPTFFNSS
jgi:hypothetical protein